MSETNIQNPETNLAPLERLNAAAAAHNFPLDPEHASRLVEDAARTASLGELTSNIFEYDGLQIGRPVLMSVSGVPRSLISRIDFVPQVDKDSDVIANPHPQRGSTTPITLMGIGAFQDFVLMADAGLIPKPERFFGTTNPTMAKIAKRIGFVETPRMTDGVIATYEDVAARVFSSEILDIQHRLEERLQRIGQATSASVVEHWNRKQFPPHPFSV
jgi:hypothetical protein